VGRSHLPSREREFGEILAKLPLPALLELRALILAMPRRRVWVWQFALPRVIGVG
jgi:hypothetical protein